MQLDHIKSVIRAARQRRQLSERDIADLVQISTPTYYDLESTGQFTTVLTLSEAARLLQVLGLGIQDLFRFEGDSQISVFQPKMLADRIQQYCSNKGLSLGEFENRVGWGVDSLFTSATTIYDAWNIDCLRDVCGAISLDWRGFILFAEELGDRPEDSTG